MWPDTPRAEDTQFRSLLVAMDEAQCTVEVRLDVSGRAVDHRILDANPAFERSSGGLGIGLSLVQRLVELPRGTVIAFSVE